MVSKNNVQVKDRQTTQQVPHYGIRKLSVGVASVLLGTTFYMGINGNVAHADTVNSQDHETPDSQVANNSNSDSAADRGAANAALGDKQANGSVTGAAVTNEVNAKPQVTEITNDSHTQSDAANTNVQNDAANTKLDASTPVNTAANTNTNTQSDAVNTNANVNTQANTNANEQSQNDQNRANTTQSMQVMRVASRVGNVSSNALNASLAESTKPVTAWQPEPTTNYSADHTAKIDMTNEPTTVHGDNWQMSLDKNYIKAGQGATLTVNYEAQAGDTFVLDIGYPSGVNVQPLNSQIGTTSTKDNGLRTQVTNVFKQAGTYTQIIKLNGWNWKGLAEGLELLRRAFGDQAFDLTLKRGTSVENAQDVGRIYLTSNFTPTMSGTGSVGVDRIDAKYVPVLSTNNNYIFSVRTNWSDSGTVLEPSYNGDFVYSISVPKTLELDQAATEAFYQQIRGNEGYGNWGNRGSNVTVSQAGVGAPVIIKANALDRVVWHYVGNEGVSFLGHFVDAPSVATTVTAEGQTTVSDTIGGHTQTITLPGLSAKVINAADYNYADSDATEFSLSDYGDHNQLYQSHEVPMTGNGNSISLINDLAVENNSPFDVKNATVTLTFGDGLHVDVDSVRNNLYISNLLADNYHPNREKSLLVTYQDGTSKTVSANSKGDPSKNIKSVTLTRGWNASQMAGMHGIGIRGFVAKTYQDGSPVKIGDTINVSLTVSGVDTNGHNVSKTIHDTLKVVDQQFAPLATENYYGGIDKTGLGDNPSGTINIHWRRTSGERGKIQLENPTLYFVMPNTVWQIKNVRWGFGKDAPGNSVPTLTSITYEKSKDGKNTVAIMHFSGVLIDQALNNFVPLYFDTVNKDNVVNQKSEGYLYWTADNVNADGLTKVDPTRVDSQNKAAHLSADLTQEQLNKIYFHAPYWGTINMATGMYSTSATKTATTPWQTQTIVDYHGDGQADVGVNLVNDTGNELHNVVAIINLPKASNNSNLTVNLTGNKVELIDPNTNSQLTDGVTVLYSTKPADLSSNDLSSFVTVDQVADWSKVQAVAVTLQSLGGMTSRQVQIPVVVNDLVANAGKAGTVGTRISADELKPIIVSASAENAAKLVVGGQATIHVQMHYQDAQGKDHYVPLTDSTHSYDILQHHILNSSDFTPSTTDLAQIPGYELSEASPTIVSGNAVIGQPVSAQDDGSVLQFELVPSTQKVLINYVDDDDDNQKVLKTDTLTGKTGETQKIDITTPNHYVLVNPATNPSEYTFLASDNKPITIHLKHATHSISDSRTVTETVHYQAADGSQVPSDHAATANFSRTGTHDEVTGTDHWNAWNVASHNFDAVPTPVKTGYTPDVQTVPAETVTPGSSNIRKVVTYTPDAQKLSVKFIDDTTGQVLKTIAKTGVTNAAAGYNTQSDIHSYEGQHYVLVSDSSHGANLIFDNNDSVDQAYEVHLKHGTHPIDEHHTITQTVHYTSTDHADVPDDHTTSVQFDRDGYHDEVTGTDHWNNWKQGGTQTFTEVPTPKKAGYTPDKPSVPATVVHPSDHNQTVAVTYTPDTQKVIVTFIDDTDSGKTLKTVTKTGPTNSSAGYTTGDDINTYKGQHYVLVSDQTHGQNITFDTDTNTDQRYEVHLKHGTHQINDRRAVTETVHYKMTDGTTAPADHTVKVDFSRDGFNDEVTGTDHWNAWTPAATHQFDAVHSPEVKGYTPDTDQITATTVNPDSQNIERTVTYSPDAQTLDVTFIDDTTGETLKTIVKNGVTHADAKYNTKSDIQDFERQHYVLVSDSSKGAALVFDNDDAADQHYVVHLKHNTHAINEHHTVNETVHYQMSDGTKAPADYRAQALSFSRDGFNDEVTGVDHWNAWTPKAEQTFDKVASPVVAGYTPDSVQIDAQTVKPTDHDLAFTVAYTPNVQIAHVKYIDDTDHKVLTQDDLNGRTGETSGYHTADRITEFKRQHYVFVSDNYPAEGMTFDNHDQIDQAYEVHFKHGTRTDEQDVQVPRTIKYVYQDGQPAQPDHSDALSFHETKVVDLVDGHTVSDDWTPVQDFKTIETPAIQGYTPDHASVSNTGISHDHSAIVETVTYNPDAQKAVVKYIDDTTGEQLEAKDLTGVSDQSTGYITKSTIDGYVNQHYVLVRDDTNGQTVVFDHNDDADQAYEVHLKHGTEPANESRIKKITVHYQYADGLARSGKAADDKTATNLTFKRTGTHDLVTDKIAWNAWDHADQTFSAIDSPAIQGYTPDRTVVDNIKVNPDSHDLTEVTVTYNADSQKLSVDFIDDTTGKTLKTINKIGYSDESADYNTKVDVQDLISKHYDLVSDATNGANLVFDHDDAADQAYEVHLIHHTHQINEQHTITETVHYRYADGLARSGKAADDFNANALKFSRDGFNDEVTGVDHWNAWTPADHQSFAAVQSPVIEGYTPNQSEIGVINVVPTSQSIEKTVTYTADAQKLTVNFIDDVSGQTLKTVAKTGYSDESVGYNTKSDIQNFVGQHYDLVSDATKSVDLVFDHNDGTDQVYDVHLTHHLTPISDHQVVNETIHYVYADGLARTGKAADNYVATPLEFNRTGKHDDVTGTDAWDAWTPGSANFAAVQSPAIQGYTPDQAQIDAASVNADSQDIVKTVTYSADPQTVTVDFIDDTDHGKVLKTITKTGGSDEAVGYNTKADIQTFVDGHYKLDHDTSNGANLVFDHDDAVDQHYEVHLTHDTAPISEATSTNQVIHYQLADGTPVANDYTAKVDFSRDGFKDLVTNADHWNAWTPNTTQTFAAVKSPAKAGYTPDHAQVDAVTVEPHHANLETTVTYSPDAQQATVKYIDDTTGKTLQTKELTGVSDETTTYTTKSTINQYVGQRYKLVSDQTHGKPVVFDHDDDNDQVFEVHLAHTYQQVSQEHQVHQTIHYRYADGKQARPDYTAKAITFSRTGTQDLVTENIQWNAWTPDQVFAAVDTPAVNGYTPDVQTTAPVKVGHDSHDIVQTVVYHADDQTILVNYIDDDTHSTLKTDSIIGKTAQTSDYTTKKSLDKYKGQHYDVVSDDTNGETLTFDSDSTKVQTYNVHLKHQHQAASDKSTVRQTVHYVYQDGKQAAKDHTATPIEFTRTGDTDLVTGTTTWNAWTPATGTFIAVVSPSIEGYTPSRVMIEHVNVHPGDKDLDTTVTYVPDRQVIVVNYIDQTTGKTLKTDTLNGHSDQTSDYTTKSQIDSYVGQHYKLISDDTHGRTLTFDHSDQATQTYDVVLGHETEAVHRTHEVHEIVDYVYADGSQAAKSFTAQPLVFSQTGAHDLVTNMTDWNGEWTKPQAFAAVASPKITGFTASKPEVKAVNIDHKSGDVHELVIYAVNAQTAQIKYIDDVTGKTLETDGANGHFGESIVFGHNVNDQINKFKQAHYKLVSNNFAGQKYQADNGKNVYEVHLTHERQNVHATDAVTETVKFQYADGSQAQPTKTQTVNFGRDGIKDLVTGTTAWMPVDPQTIGAVDVPVLDGYTADTDQVPAVKVNFGDNDIEKVVTYTANDQTAGIKIIDDATGKVLNTQSATGKFGTEIQFKQNPDQQVIDLQAQHYELVSDNFKHQAYKSDNAQNQFEIHVRHQTADTQRTDAVTETVHYRDNHGNQLRPDTQATKTFTQSGVIDKVTGDITWNPVASQTIDQVTAPEITGYTPDRNSVPAATVNLGDDDIDQTIVYTPVQEPASIKYVDDTTGKTLLTDHTTGNFGTQINFDHDPIAQIGQYESQGYKLVSNNYGNSAHQFSATASENNFEVHLTHGTKDAVRTSTVNRVINYVDSATGEKLRPSTTQTLTFTEHGTTDEVTGETTWTDSPVQHFAKIATPEIEGYTTEVKTVDSVAANFGDADLEVNVPYTKVTVPDTPNTPGTPDQPGTPKTPKTPSTPEQPEVPSQPGAPQLLEHPAAAPADRQANHAQPAANNATTATELPQTGDDSQHGATLAGLGLIGMMGALFGFKKKRERKN